MAVKAKAFLALEKSLTDRLQASWNRVYLQVSGNVKSLLEDGKVPEAYEAAYALNLDSLVTENLAKIRYLAYSALFFGASRLSRRESVRDAMIGSVNLEPQVDNAVKLLTKFIRFNLTFQLQRKLLQVISEYQASRPDTLGGPSERDALKVRKAEEPILTQEFVSFQKEGDKMLQLISSLHTSRVSAYGFTVEADILGVEEYAVSEQLDNRICPVCEVMHGKKFKVRDAADALNNILATDDPEMLKILQPWPKQNPDSVQWLSDLSSQQLVDRNWHIPPYHPNCRGLLVHVDKVPDIKDTASYRAAFGNQAPKPTLLAPEDLLAFASVASGVYGDPATQARQLADHWNRHGRGQDLFQTVQDLLGLKRDEMSRLMAEHPGTGHFPLDVHFSSAKELIVQYAGEIFGTSGTGRLSLALQPTKNEMYVSLAVLPSSAQGRGLMKQILRTWVPVLERMGIDKITLQANIDTGAYAWARYGWVPDKLQPYVISRIEARLMENFSIPNKVYDTVSAAIKRLKAGDHTAIWAIADIPRWGFKLLRGISWDGVLNMSDPATMRRFLNYISVAK